MAASMVGEVAQVGAQKVGGFAKETGELIKSKDWSKEKETWDKVSQGTVRAVSSVGTQAVQSAQSLTRQATQSLGLSVGASLETTCKQESQSTPCPRVLLVCCNAIAAGNLNEKGIFRKDGPPELVDMLHSLLVQGNGVALIPKNTSPVTVAAVVKRFLRSLPEPLLTFKLVNEFLTAGMSNSKTSSELIQQLPSANYNSLVLLLDCAKRISDNADANGMTLRQIAEELAPTLLWHPLPKDVPKDPTQPPGRTGIQALTDKELVAAANVVEHLIGSQA